MPNYDGTEQIPAVMPTRIPNLLVNGSSGIAVGMATNIPPHNLSEVIDGCLAYIEDENISIEGLMEYILAQTSQQQPLLMAAVVLKRLIVLVAVRSISAHVLKSKRMPKRAVKPLLFMRSRIR